MLRTYNAVLENVSQLTPRVKEFRFKIDQHLDFKTGQWLMLEIPGQEETIKRAMSIASPAYEKDTVDFCVKKIEGGKGSTAMHLMQPGEKISFTGPFGRFILNYPTNADIVMIATGSGISPFKAMALELLENKKVPNQIYLLFGNRTEDEIIYRTFFEELANTYPNFHFIPTLSRPHETWQGEVGRVQELIKKYISPENKNREFYLCGLKDMILTTLELLEKSGFYKQNIHFERYN